MQVYWIDTRRIITRVMKMIEISRTKRNSELEERMNIHPGRIYRVKLYGINPMHAINFDGELEGIMAEEMNGEHIIRSIALLNGITYSTFNDPTIKPSIFDRELIDVNSNRILGFGNVLDEKGFYRKRSEIKENLSKE